MRIEQILKVLKNERECIKRQSGVKAPDGSVGICDRNCANCSLVLPDTEILEVYDHLIKEKELEYKFASRVDEDGREHFKGICPYTGKKCDTWTCGICEVEERERKFMEGDND